MLWQAFFKSLNSVLHIEGEGVVIELESWSFSSGQVAVPLSNSGNSVRLREKQSGEDDGTLCSLSPLSSGYFGSISRILPAVLQTCVGDKGGSGVIFTPDQGMAIAALREKKLSDDQIFFFRDALSLQL